MRIRNEYAAVCLTCGGPLMVVDTATVFDKPGRGPRLPVHVHARHRDWADHPHPAVVVNLTAAA